MPKEIEQKIEELTPDVLSRPDVLTVLDANILSRPKLSENKLLLDKEDGDKPQESDTEVVD